MTSSLHTLKRARQVIQFSRTFQNENSPILSLFTSFNKLTRVSTSNIYHLMSDSSSYECNILYFAIKWTYIMKIFYRKQTMVDKKENQDGSQYFPDIARFMSACDRYIQGYFFFSEQVKSKWTRTRQLFVFFLVNCNLCYQSMV